MEMALKRDLIALADRRFDLVVIGGGIGGLVAGAALARSGLDVTLLESQTYLGGCAGTKDLGQDIASQLRR
jgi:phytoene dehydrogenase-like protein